MSITDRIFAAIEKLTPVLTLILTPLILCYKAYSGYLKDKSINKEVLKKLEDKVDRYQEKTVERFEHVEERIAHSEEKFHEFIVDTMNTFINKK